VILARGHFPFEPSHQSFRPKVMIDPCFRILTCSDGNRRPALGGRTGSRNMAKSKTTKATKQADKAKPGAKAAKTKPEAKPKKVSALDAAATLLASASEPMNCQAMIEAMATRGLWSGPNGKTLAATPYSAILREIATKGKESRFKKTERGTTSAAVCANMGMRFPTLSGFFSTLAHVINSQCITTVRLIGIVD